MRSLIDISTRLEPGMPIWPESVGIRVSSTLRIANGSPANVSRLDMDVHCGTHVESPLHYLVDGAPIDDIPLETFVGPALVVDTDVETVTPEVLASLPIPSGTLRLLLRTSNSRFWRTEPRDFRPDYVALTPEAAHWIANRGVRLVGIDYLSIQRYSDDPETHRILMRGGVTILEGLDLSDAGPGSYFLAALPLRITGAEAAPVRAVLMPIDVVPE